MKVTIVFYIFWAAALAGALNWALTDDFAFDQTGQALADVDTKDGMVQYRPEGLSLWADARIGTPLYEGNVVATGQQSETEIVFRDGQVLKLGSSAQVRISRESGDAESLLVTVLRGQVEAGERRESRWAALNPNRAAASGGSGGLFGLGSGSSTTNPSAAGNATSTNPTSGTGQTGPTGTTPPATSTSPGLNLPSTPALRLQVGDQVISTQSTANSASRVRVNLNSDTGAGSVEVLSGSATMGSPSLGQSNQILRQGASPISVRAAAIRRDSQPEESIEDIDIDLDSMIRANLNSTSAATSADGTNSAAGSEASLATSSVAGGFNLRARSAPPTEQIASIDTSEPEARPTPTPTPRPTSRPTPRPTPMSAPEPVDAGQPRTFTAASFNNAQLSLQVPGGREIWAVNSLNSPGMGLNIGVVARNLPAGASVRPVIQVGENSDSIVRGRRNLTASGTLQIVVPGRRLAQVLRQGQVILRPAIQYQGRTVKRGAAITVTINQLQQSGAGPVAVFLDRLRVGTASNWLNVSGGLTAGNARYTLFLPSGRLLPQISSILAGAQRIGIAPGVRPVAQANLHVVANRRLVASLQGGSVADIRVVRRALRGSLAYRGNAGDIISLEELPRIVAQLERGRPYYVANNGNVVRVNSKLVKTTPAAARLLEQTADAAFRRPVEIVAGASP